LEGWGRGPIPVPKGLKGVPPGELTRVDSFPQRKASTIPEPGKGFGQLPEIGPGSIPAIPLGGLGRPGSQGVIGLGPANF